MSQGQLVSPVPGVFFRRPAPDSPPYKEEGDAIVAGDVYCLIELMKTFYEVKAEIGGHIVKFLVEDNAAVEAGQPLVEMAT